MSTLGSSTKAFLARVVQTLPYLHSDAAAIPTQHRDFWAGVQSRYAANHFSTNGDPKVLAAQAHLEDELQKALDEDNKTEESKEEQPAGRTEPQPLSDEELDRMTAPHPAEDDQKEGE